MATSRSWRDRIVHIAMLAACVGLLGWGGKAHALAYFTGPDGFGFSSDDLDEELDPTYRIDSAEEFVPAGSRQLNDGGFVLAFSSKQTVKKKEHGHFRITVEWKIKNKTGSKIDSALLLLTSLAGPPDYEDYSGVPIHVLVNSSKPQDFTVARFDRETEDMYFLGFLLENMKPGNKGVVKAKFKYDVLRDGGLINRTAPALGVAAVLDPKFIPEPSAIVLLGVGAASITWWSRRRRS